MTMPFETPHALFDGSRLLERGQLQALLPTVVARAGIGADGRPLLLLNDGTGEALDLDLRGDLEQVRARLQARFAASTEAHEAGPRERGRPRLGVVAREVTLLPRHWEWLATQRGGASQALRRLVDAARRREEGQGGHARQEATYKAMLVLAGDLPGFEDASRALFAGDAPGWAALAGQWPADVRDYLASLSAKPAG